MAYTDDLNQFASQNPDDAAYTPGVDPTQQESQGDPLLAGAPNRPRRQPVNYGGLTGDPFQTALVASAQLDAFKPQVRPPSAQPPPPPFAGLSAYLGA